MAINTFTLSQLRNHIRLRVNDANTSFTSDGFLNDIINIGQLEVIKVIGRLEGEQTITIDGGTASYDLPSDFMDTIDVQYKATGENRWLEYMSPELYRSFSTINSISIPTHYTFIGEKLYIWETPSTDNDTVSHRYFAFPAKLVNDTDFPFNGIVRYYPYHDILVSHAITCLPPSRVDMETSSWYKQQYGEALSIMKNNLMSKRVSGSGQMESKAEKRSYIYPYDMVARYL